MKVEALPKLLQKHSAAPVPPPFQLALQRWEANGTQAKVESLLVQRVSKPEVLTELLKSKAARFLGEPLGARRPSLSSRGRIQSPGGARRDGLLPDATGIHGPVEEQG